MNSDLLSGSMARSGLLLAFDTKNHEPKIFNLIEGRWYLITRHYDYYLYANGQKYKRHRVECRKCLCATEAHGLFCVEDFDDDSTKKNIWIPIEDCIPYEGKMKKQYIFWGDEVPDI